GGYGCIPWQSKQPSDSNSIDPITDEDLQDLSEALLAADVNNVGNQVEVNLQGLTSTHGTDDAAPKPLLKVPESALSGPTFAVLVALQDNYIADVMTHEQDDQVKQQERSAFLNVIMATDIMKNTQKFLSDKGVISGELRSVLEEIWFTPYSRSTAGPLSSSGFEHNFVGEIKSGKVSGFHNWVYFAHEEKKINLNYQGHLHKSVSLSAKGQVMWPRFTWLTEPKPMGAIMVGTSPELELALYTVCFLVRPNQKCPLLMNGQHFNVQTWVYEFDGKRLISGAYPESV
ncbi:unnamed protein product, partial [Meganyctiphanes norvegica]